MFGFSRKALFRPFSTVATKASTQVVRPVIRTFRPMQVFIWRLTPDTQVSSISVFILIVITECYLGVKCGIAPTASFRRVIEQCCLHWQAGEIQKTFAQFGPVRSVTMQFDEKTGNPKGSAVVQYTVHEDAQSAIDYYTQRGIVINGQRLALKWQQSLQRRLQNSTPANGLQKKRPPGLSGPGHQVFVKNLYYSTGEQQLKEAFSAFGEVLFLEVLRDTEGLSRGMARIRFAKKEDADTAISGLNGVSFDGRNLIVHYDDQFVSTGEAMAGSAGDDSVPVCSVRTCLTCRKPKILMMM